MMKKIILVAILLALPLACFAETVTLKSGETIEGKIVEKTDKYIKIDFEGVSLTYWLEDIESIGGQPLLSPAITIDKEHPIAKTNTKTEDFTEDSSRVISNDHKDIFEERLTKFLKQPSGIAAFMLLKFSKDYPDSKFAPDAEYFIKFLQYIGAVGARDKEVALKYYKEIEEFVNLHPDGSLDEFTCKKYLEFGGEGSSRTVYIPYRNILQFMRGDMGFWFMDHQSVIDNFSLLKDELDFSKDKTGMLAYEIYFPLATAYKQTNRLNDWNNIAKEAAERLPNTLWQRIQGVFDKNKSQ
ncbi:tol-pal system YbgF family protein [Candidatus Omnitrophota bacterium]